MKLVNPASELRCLKTICDGNPRLASAAMNSVGDETFSHEPALEAWRRIQVVIKSQGDIPSWADLVADPAISEVNRTLLRKDPQKAISIANEDKLKSLLKNLDRYRQLRNLLELGSEIMDSLEDESVDVDKLMDEASTILLKARTKADAQKKMMHIGRGNNTSRMMMDLLSGKHKPVVQTGFKAFDSVNGGFLDGSLVVIAANTGGGKSTMAINLAHNITKYGHDVLIVPLEMTEDQMAARLFGLRTNLDVGKISQHKLAKAEKKIVAKDYKKYVAELKTDETRITIWSPEEDLSIEEILLSVKHFKYKVIIIDYISLLKGADDDDQAKKLGAIARFGKVFAKNNKCIVILLAQLDDKTKNIRYARAIREHANNAWFWFMPEEEQDESIMDIRQVKARNQKRFGFQLISHNKSMLITDMDDAHRDQANNPETQEKVNKHFEGLDEEDDEED